MPKNAIKPSVFVEKMVIQANLFASYDYTGWVFELSIVSELRFWSRQFSRYPTSLGMAPRTTLRAQKSIF